MRTPLLLLTACCAVAAAVPAPPAHAALAEGVVPVVERVITRVPGGFQARLGPSLYVRVARKVVDFDCQVVERSGPGGVVRSDRGMAETVRAPRRRSPLRVRLAVERPDLCVLSVRATEGSSVICEDGWCPIAIQAFTEAGRVRIDELQRTADISLLVFGAMLTAPGDRWPTYAQLVEALEDGDGLAPMSGPDETPATRGTVGYWTDGTTLVAAARARDGRRLFLRFHGDTLSTNLPDFHAGS